MINGKHFFDQLIKTDLKTYYKIWKITTGQENDCKTGYLLGYNYFIK